MTLITGNSVEFDHIPQARIKKLAPMTNLASAPPADVWLYL